MLQARTAVRGPDGAWWLLPFCHRPSRHSGVLCYLFLGSHRRGCTADADVHLLSLNHVLTAHRCARLAAGHRTRASETASHARTTLRARCALTCLPNARRPSVHRRQPLGRAHRALRAPPIVLSLSRCRSAALPLCRAQHIVITMPTLACSLAGLAPSRPGGAHALRAGFPSSTCAHAHTLASYS